MSAGRPAPPARRREGVELSILELVLLGLAGIAAFGVLYMVGLVVLRGGGGDDIKDIGLD